MTLENFVRYMHSQHEHRPLYAMNEIFTLLCCITFNLFGFSYLFDQKYAENAKEMLNDYEIPPYFKEDLFALAEEERPPFRSLLYEKMKKKKKRICSY